MTVSAARARPRALFPGFAGVALADILANGVAMVIILIVITVSIRNAQEQERLEQAQDVSLLLSRELATSVVMNALPTSPPSVLHDYERSPLDQNPQHSVMPILELRRDGVRNRYNGRFWPRRELLLQDNSLDRYLQTFDDQQRRNIRLDVYSIRNFYLAMSILKSHQVRAAHWHFLGEAADAGRPLLGGVGDGEGEGGWRDAEGEDARPGEGRGQRRGRGLRRGRPGGARIPQGVDWVGGETLPDYPGAGRDRSADPNASGAGGGVPGRRTIRFRLPVDGAPPPAGSMPRLPADLQPAQLIAALYRFMGDIQRRADGGEYGALAAANLSRALALHLQTPFSDSELRRAGDLLGALRRPWPGPRRGVAVRRISAPGASALRLTADARQAQVWALDHSAFAAADANAAVATDATADVELRLGRWPAIYQGLSLALHHGGLALVAPGQQSPAEWRWRVVALTDPALSDGMVGFVYSRLTADGHLLIAGEENGVTIGGRPLRTEFLTHFLRNERMLLMLYALLVVFILAMLARRFRR